MAHNPIANSRRRQRSSFATRGAGALSQASGEDDRTVVSSLPPLLATARSADMPLLRLPLLTGLALLVYVVALHHAGEAVQHDVAGEAAHELGLELLGA